jgi:hypothetical protein
VSEPAKWVQPLTLYPVMVEPDELRLLDSFTGLRRLWLLLVTVSLELDSRMRYQSWPQISRAQTSYAYSTDEADQTEQDLVPGRSLAPAEAEPMRHRRWHDLCVPLELWD